MNAQPIYAQVIENMYRNQCLPYDTVSCSEKNVSTALISEIKKWTFYPVLINAPTGSGKSTFVFQALADFAAKKGGDVLVLSNRLALNLQQKESLCAMYHLPCIGSKALAHIKSFRNVTLLTYQGVLQELNNGYIPTRPIHYIVFDEAHFFCSDSVFNPWTTSILVALQNAFPKAIRIYMSATPENVKPMLAAFEKQHLDMLFQTSQDRNPNYDPFLDFRVQTNAPKILEYKFPADFQNVSLSFFYKWDFLLDTIMESSDSPEKWLIFVSEKTVGKYLKKELGSDCADYIDAESPFSYIASLSYRQRFTKKVLISTSVIDNGLSIHDYDLTHIVIDTLDRVELIQMLGRKRLDPDEKIHLHVKLPSENEKLSMYRQTAENLYATIISYKKNPAYFISSNWGELTTGQQNLFAPYIQNGSLFLGPNVFAEYQLALKCKELEQLEIQLEQDKFAFAKQVCHWLHKEFWPNMILDNSSRSDIKIQMNVILSAKLNIPITAASGIDELSKELKACLSTPHEMPSQLRMKI